MIILRIAMPFRRDFFPAMEPRPVRRSPDPRILSSFAYIEANLHQRIRLTDLVGESGLSPSRFSHLFALSTGMPPGRYIRALRKRQRPAHQMSEARIAVEQGRIPRELQTI